MPRKPIVRSNRHYYHITARSNNKESFCIPLDHVWKIMTGHLKTLQKEHDLRILGFVLMGNHFHLLMLSPKTDIDRIMYFFMKSVTKDIQFASGRINKIFGGRYKGCLIDHAHYLLNAYKYVLRNPLAAKLVDRAEDYQFGTLYFETSKLNLPFLVEEIPELEKSGHTVFLNWINEAFAGSDHERVKWGLTKSTFKMKRAD